MNHVKNQRLCVIDVETTPHEIWQVAFLPATSDLKPMSSEALTMVIRPQEPEKADRQIMRVTEEEYNEILSASLNHEQAADKFESWFRGLRKKGLLGCGGKLLPIAQNAHFDRFQVGQWLSAEMMDEAFHAWYRDPMNLAVMINDITMLNSHIRGEETPIPYERCNLDYLCKKHNVTNNKAHDAFEDCCATLEVYRKMVLAHYGAAF